MNTRAVTVLEFDRIRQSLVESCLSPEGRDQLQHAGFESDPTTVSATIRQVAAYRSLLLEQDEPGSYRFADIYDALTTLRVEGNPLDGELLVSAAHYIASAGRMKSFIAEHDTTGELKGLFGHINVPTEVARSILYMLDDSGNVREERVPELKKIRGRIRQIQGQIISKARSYIGQSQEFFSSNEPVSKEGRTVLPIKIDFKGRIPGIVHDVSSSGQTVFVEPFDLVDSNNELAEAHAEYRAVVLAVYRDLSATLRTVRDELKDCTDAVARADQIRSRARYSIDHDCVAVKTGTCIRLVQARHPLLPKRSCVPIDIQFEQPTRCLILTGPNTGGKTVALKTLGLLSLMHQFGMELPVAPGSELPVFDDIFADIGDEQSIEQSLSTFSAHMKAVADVVHNSTSSSLVLLDELGSGTDPHEGGALGMAILDHLVFTGCYSLITTHHGALKRYGYTHDRVENASMEFDEESLAPTYRVLAGVPGSSHALSIAQRSGLPEAVLHAARSYVADGSGDVAALLRSLEKTQADLEHERRSLNEEMRKLKKREGDLAAQTEKLQDERNKLKSGRLRELDQFAATARSTLEKLVRELREGEINRETTRRIKEFNRETQDTIDAHRASMSDVSPPRERVSDATRQRTRTTDRPIEPGVRVRVLPGSVTGTVERRSKRNTWLVATETIRMTVPEANLQPIDEPEPRSGRIDIRTETGASPGVFELDLRGERLADALDRLEKQIDSCLASGRTFFSVLHGTGEGVLQKGVRELLSARSEVARYETARPEDGGAGKTLVTLK
ncbi:MAG: endonuclease MutS2 [Spirochaetaceae bacterium]